MMVRMIFGRLAAGRGLKRRERRAPKAEFAHRRGRARQGQCACLADLSRRNPMKTEVGRRRMSKNFSTRFGNGRMTGTVGKYRLQSAMLFRLFLLIHGFPSLARPRRFDVKMLYRKLLINTRLQPGARKVRAEKNRLNGFFLGTFVVHRVKTLC